MTPVPLTKESISIAVIVTHVEFSTTMEANKIYMFVSTTNCWIKQDTTAGITALPATAAALSMFWPANKELFLEGRNGATLSVIRDTADGRASLTRIIRD